MRLGALAFRGIGVGRHLVEAGDKLGNGADALRTISEHIGEERLSVFLSKRLGRLSSGMIEPERRAILEELLALRIVVEYPQQR